MNKDEKLLLSNIQQSLIILLKKQAALSQRMDRIEADMHHATAVSRMFTTLDTTDKKEDT